MKFEDFHVKNKIFTNILKDLDVFSFKKNFLEKIIFQNNNISTYNIINVKDAKVLP